MVNDVVERDPSVNGVRYGQYGGSIVFLSTWSFELIVPRDTRALSRFINGKFIWPRDP